MLIANYTITDGQYKEISSHLTDDINDIVASNYTKYLSSNGFQSLRTFVNFEQVRFYCTTDHPGRTIHLKTMPHPTYYQMLDFLGTARTAPIHFQSVELYPDDDAILSRDRRRWGYNGGSYHNEFLGSSGFPSTGLYQDALVIYGERTWHVGYLNRLICDTYGADPNMRFSTWQIFIK